MSIPASAVVMTSSIGVISPSTPAANSLNLPPMTLILSLIVSKVRALSSIILGIDPSSPFAFAIAPSKSCRNASVRPPDFPKNSIDAAARSAGVGSSEIALASIWSCSVGDLSCISDQLRPRVLNFSWASSDPAAASTSTFCILLIDVPTLSAPTPLLSNARWSTSNLPDVSPVCSERSASSPPRSSASLNAPKVPVTAAAAILIAPNPSASAAPALAMLAKLAFTLELVLATVASRLLVESLTLFTVEVKPASVAPNLILMPLIVFPVF